MNTKLFIEELVNAGENTMNIQDILCKYNPRHIKGEKMNLKFTKREIDPEIKKKYDIICSKFGSTFDILRNKAISTNLSENEFVKELQDVLCEHFDNKWQFVVYPDKQIANYGENVLERIIYTIILDTEIEQESSGTENIPIEDTELRCRGDNNHLSIVVKDYIKLPKTTLTRTNFHYIKYRDGKNGINISLCHPEDSDKTEIIGKYERKQKNSCSRGELYLLANDYVNSINHKDAMEKYTKYNNLLECYITETKEVKNKIFAITNH